MDSLKSLFDAQKYELVLKLTEGSQKEVDLFYRIASFSCLGKYEDALFVIQDHQDNLRNNLVSLIPIHIELLCALERYEQAHIVMDEYSNLPYQSQQVEEILRKMPKVIEQEEKKKGAITFSDDEVFASLNSSENEEILFGLDLVKKRDVFTFLPEMYPIRSITRI